MSGCGHYTQSPDGRCNICACADILRQLPPVATVVCHRCEGVGFLSVNKPRDRACDVCNTAGHITAELWTPDRAEHRSEVLRERAPHMFDGGDK